MLITIRACIYLKSDWNEKPRYKYMRPQVGARRSDDGKSNRIERKVFKRWAHERKDTLQSPEFLTLLYIIYYSFTFVIRSFFLILLIWISGFFFYTYTDYRTLRVQAFTRCVPFISRKKLRKDTKCYETPGLCESHFFSFIT